MNEAGEALGAPVMLTDDGLFVFNEQPSWSNDGKTIVFHSNRGNMVFDFDIWTIPSAGGTPTLLTGTTGYGDYDPVYSKNGKYVAYDKWTEFPPPTTQLTGVSAEKNIDNAVSERFTLKPNYPNPFNGNTTIEFSVTESNYTKLVVYNSLGSEVATLFNGMAEADQIYKVVLNGSELARGVYFYRLQIGDTLFGMNKMMLAK